MAVREGIPGACALRPEVLLEVVGVAVCVSDAAPLVPVALQWDAAAVMLDDVRKLY